MNERVRDEAERLLTIDELSQASGVTTRTIRFYSQEKLVPPPADFRGRVALYGQEHLARLRLIKTLKDKYLPLELIRKVIASPGKLAFVQEKLLTLDSTVFELLGYKPATLTQKRLAQRSRLSEQEISKLTGLGFLFPSSTETGPRFSADDLDTVIRLKELAKLGLTPEELVFIPKTLQKLTDTFVDTAHEKFHAAFAHKPAEARSAIEAAVKANKELFSLVYQQAFRRTHRRVVGGLDHDRKAFGKESKRPI